LLVLVLVPVPVRVRVQVPRLALPLRPDLVQEPAEEQA